MNSSNRASVAERKPAPFLPRRTVLGLREVANDANAAAAKIYVLLVKEKQCCDRATD